MSDTVPAKKSLIQLLRESPIPEAELGRNLGLYMDRQALSRLLFIRDLYEKIIPVHGNVVEFGTRWGQNLALFHSFRGFYEPFNMNRRIIGFDTFEGFPDVDARDGDYEHAREGAMGVVAGYEQHLDEVLAQHEARSPLSHLRRYEIIKGDAVAKFRDYLEQNPQATVALAFFDLDLYRPTKECLELVRPRLTKGSVVAFDELNVKEWQGETIAYREVFSLDRYAIRRCPYSSAASYIVIE